MSTLLATLLACTTDDVGFGAGGNQTDNDGAGVPSLVDDDDAGDTAAASACEGADLDFVVEVVGSVDDGSGSGSGTLTWPAEVTGLARLDNDCGGPVSFATSTSCVVTEWSLSGADDVDFGGNCAAVETVWTVDDGDAIEVYAEFGTLDRGAWSLTAQSAITGSRVSAAFTVE